MAKTTNGRYSKEFRNEAVKMVIEGGLSAYEASRQLSLPKSTLENWGESPQGRETWRYWRLTTAAH